MRSDEWRPRWELANGREDVNPSRLYETRDGQWEQPRPVACQNGHRLGPGRVLLGWQACQATQGHLTWTCLRCDHTIWHPPIVSECTHTAFDDRPAEPH